MPQLIALVLALAPSGNIDLSQTALNPNPREKSYIARAELVARTHPLVGLVDDTAALVRRVVYEYGAGSVLSFDQRYQAVGGSHVPASIDITAHLPGYSVDRTIRFSEYRTNVPVLLNATRRP